MLVVELDDGENVPILLCDRCRQETFSKDNWDKLFGVHPGTTQIDASRTACFDGELVYNIQTFDYQNIPRRRGPILRLTVPVKDILDSESCGFCGILKSLNTEQQLGVHQKETVKVDLQLFRSDRYHASFLPFIIRVSMTLDGPGQKSSVTSTNLTIICGKSETYDTDNPSQDDTHPLSDMEIADALNISYGLVELKEWLQECQSNHPQCVLSQRPRLPMRVIDVLAFGDVDHVKLVENMERPNGDYVALSYVWGGRNTTRLVQATRDSLISNISLQELPDTLRDAVRVTRSLNIRYLWIDSLCIMQDDSADKDMQIPYMNEYYRGAIAVISASGADDVHAGFLQAQQTKDTVLARVESQMIAHHPELGSTPLRILGFLPNFDEISLLTVDSEPRLYSYHEEPINKRAWTLQESALARRLLTFPSTGGIVMRCHDGETLIGEVISDPFHEDPAFTYPEDKSQPHHSAAEIFRRWTAIVEDYSRRSLSYPGDVLVALGALALETYSRDGIFLGTYVAGLWTNTLLEGLLWHISQPPHAGRKSFRPPYQTISYCQHAPSWSWASCGQPIVFRTQREPDISYLDFMEKEEPSWCAEIIHCKVLLQKELNPFGAVKNGYIDLKCILIPLRRVTKDGSDAEFDTCDVEDIALVLDSTEYVQRPDIFAPDALDSLDLINSSCFWLPLYHATRSRCRGIIVRETIPGHFFRLGFAEFSTYPTTMEGIESRKIRLN